METVLSEHFVFLNDKDMDLPIQVVYGENSPFIVSECQRAEGYSFKLKPGEKVFSDDLDMLRRAFPPEGRRGVRTSRLLADLHPQRCAGDTFHSQRNDKAENQEKIL